MSDSTQAQLRQVLELLQAGRNQEAYRILNPLLQANPNNDNAWWLMAHTVTEPGYVRLALENVVRLRPDYTPALDMLNDLNRQAGLPPASRPPAPPVYDTSPAAYEYESYAVPTEAPARYFGLGNFLGGAALGILGGIIAGVLWVLFTILRAGEEMEVPVAVVVLIGGAVGIAVYVGAGRKRSVIMALFSAAITLLVMAVGQFVVIRHFFIQVLGAENVNLGDLISATFETVVNDPVSPPTLVYWGIALLLAFVVPMLGRGRGRN
ncbi:MAG: hypothetical protein JXB47_00830 [Anaerolineae bacterium]|nr:hypothetical protein [Anaerolineae bacterium]